MKLFWRLLAVVSLSAAAMATSLPSTTLAAAVADGKVTTIRVTSASNFVVGYYAVVDSEAMLVQAIQGTTITVTRGVQSTNAVSHASGNTIYVGPASYFQNADAYSGSICSSTNDITPWVNIRNGLVWNCTSSQWVSTIGGGGGGNTTSTSLVAGNLPVASGAHDVIDSGLVATSLVPPGQITVVHKDGTQTVYNAASNTNAARGTALLSALTAGADGDVIYLPANTFEMGACTNAGYNSAQTCVDLSKSGTITMSLIGAGKYSTIIQSTAVGTGNKSILVQMGLSGSVVSNLTVKHVMTPSSGCGTCLGPIGTTANGAAPTITNGLINNVNIIGVTDGVVMFNDTGSTLTVYNTDITTQWDAFAGASTGSTINLYNVNMTGVADSFNHNALGIKFLSYGGSPSTTVINGWNVTSNMSGTSAAIVAYAVDQGVVLNLYSGWAQTAGTGTLYDLKVNNNIATSIINVAPGFGYDPSKTNVTGTLAFLPNVVEGVNVTGVQGNGAKIQLSTGSTTTDNCVKFDANGNTVDAGSACGGSGSPGGSNTQLQYNNSGAFGGIADLTFDGTHTITLGASGLLDLSAAAVLTAFKPPKGALASPTTDGVVAFDTSLHNLVYGNGSTTNHSAFVTGAAPSAGVATFAGSTYALTSSTSPALTSPTLTTQTQGDNSTKAASTAYVAGTIAQGSSDTITNPSGSRSNFATTYVIPANALKVGSVLRVIVRGVGNESASAAGYTVDMGVGGTFIAPGVSAAPSTGVNLAWRVSLECDVTAVGSGTTSLTCIQITATQTNNTGGGTTTTFYQVVGSLDSTSTITIQPALHAITTTGTFTLVTNEAHIL